MSELIALASKSSRSSNQVSNSDNARAIKSESQSGNPGIFKNCLKKMGEKEEQLSHSNEENADLYPEQAMTAQVRIVPFPLGGIVLNGEYSNQTDQDSSVASGMQADRANNSNAITSENIALEMIIPANSTGEGGKNSNGINPEKVDESKLLKPEVKNNEKIHIEAINSKNTLTDIPGRDNGLDGSKESHTGVKKVQGQDLAKLMKVPADNVQEEGGFKAPAENGGKINEVKSLMDFESRRINSSKLSVMQDTGADVDTNSSRPQLNVNNVVLPHKTVGTVPTTPANAREIIDQIVEKAVMIQQKNSTEMKVDLKPDFLGKMTIKIVVEDGLLTARFITDNHQVKHILESNMNTLRQTLENQGVRVERTEVNVQLNNGGTSGDSGEGQERWQQEQLQRRNYNSNSIEETVQLDETYGYEETLPEYSGQTGYDESTMNFIA